jgi:hypothetical protein
MLKSLIAGLFVFSALCAPALAFGQSAPSMPSFADNLQLWDQGSEVLSLQQFLNQDGFPVSRTGAGSSGQETDFFGLKTYAALVKFQAAEDLPATGYFGPLTRAAVDDTSRSSNSSETLQAQLNGLLQQIARLQTSSTSTLATTTASFATTAPGIPQALSLPAGYAPGYGGGGGTSGTSGRGSTPDTPTVSLTAPSSDATVSGSTVTLTATASDNVAVGSVQFEVDGVAIGWAATTSPYTITWDSTGVTNGSHTLSAVAEDTSGNYATSSITVAVDNAPPAVFDSLVPIVTSSQVGQAVSYTPGIYTGIPTPTITHQWTLNGSPISDGYILASGDIGKSLALAETATNVNGTVSASSLAKTVTTALPIPLGGRFKIGDVNYASTPILYSTPQPLLTGGTEYFVNNTGESLNGFQVGYSYSKPSNAGTNSVREILIDSGGTGYSTATAAVSGGSGSGAVLGTIVSGSTVTAIYILNPGSGWLAGQTPTITITGDGTGAAAHVTRMDGIGEVAYRYDSVASSSLEYPLGTLTPFAFAGSSSVAISHGTSVTSDILTLGAAIPTGAIFGIKSGENIGTGVTLAAATSSGVITSLSITNPGTGHWDTSYTIGSSGGTGSGLAATAYTYQGRVVFVQVTNGGSGYTTLPHTYMNINVERPLPTSPLIGDKNFAGAAITSASVVAAPDFVSATPASYNASGVVIGDSIANGFAGGDSAGDYLGDYGYIARATGPAGLGLLKLTLPGDYASSFNAQNAARVALMQQLPGMNFAIDQYGTNDVARGDSLATVEASLIANWTTLHTYVPNVYQTTILPESSSTDGWTTLANQTPIAGFGPGSVQASLNAWLRDGAPMSNGVAVAAGSTGTGVLRAGQTGDPLTGVFDVARQVESSINPDSGVWTPFAYPGIIITNGATSDGVHPSDAYHAMIVGRVASLTMTSPGTGYVSAPTVSWSNLGIPQAAAVVSGGALQSITAVDDGGVNYAFPPPITIKAIGGAGSGATAKAIMSGNRITGYTVTAAGSGYTNGAIVEIGGDFPPQAHTVVNGDGTVGIVLDWGGSGITQVPTVTLTGGGGTSAIATATIMDGINTSELQ